MWNLCPVLSGNKALIVVVLISTLPIGCTPRTPITARSAQDLNSNTPDERPSEDAKRIQFVDAAEPAGIHWIGVNGEDAQQYTILEQLGAGCAIDDYDRDGQPDLFFAGGGTINSNLEILPVPIGLYRQMNKWQFQKVTSPARLEPIRHYHHGMWSADADEDGFPDLLITGWAGLQLFHNQGDGTFSDQTDISGLTDTMWSSAAGWADLNQDQILDLYVGHYVNWSFDNNPPCYYDKSKDQRDVCGPISFDGLPCTVYVSNADGTYREASQELGIHEIGKALGAVIADINDDNRPDIYVANDMLANQLYLSQPGGGYREMAVESGVAFGEMAKADGSMGADIADIDGDGRLDYWVANFEKQNFALYRNLGLGAFAHSSRAYGIGALGTSAVGFGTVLLDADGDGFPDIYSANGHVWSAYIKAERRQLPYLLWNDHGRRFRDIAGQSGDYLRKVHLSRGLACGDLDANGTPDLVVTNTAEPAALLRNETVIPNWLSVQLIGRSSNRSAIGARVTIVAGQHRQIGLVKGGSSYLSTSERTLLFGLGQSSVVEALDVRWPSGKTSTLANIPAGQRIQIVEEAGH